MSDSRTKRTKKNVLVGFIGFFVTTILSFIVRTIFIRTLSVELLGVDGLFSNILQILSLGELGLSNVAMFTLYKPLADNDKKRVSSLIKFYSKTYNYIAIFILVLGLLFIPFLNLVINSDIGYFDLIKFYVLYLVNTCISYIGISKQILVNADQKAYLVKNANMVFNLIKSVLQIIILFIARSYVCYLIIQCLITAVQNYYLAKKISKDYRISDAGVVLSKIEKKDIIKKTKDLAIYKVCVVIINSTDNIFISILLGTATVGYYSNYALIFSAIGTAFSIIITSIISSLGNLTAKESNERKISFFYELLGIMQVITSVVCICIFFLINDFIQLWIGADFILPLSAVIVLTANFYLSNIINPVWMYREAMGLYHEVKYTMIFTALFNISLTWILGITLGLLGIFLATIISRLITTVWYEPIILLKRQLKTSIGKYYLSQIRNLVITILLTITLYFIFGQFHVNNLISWIVKGALIFIISTIVFVFINRENPQIKKMLRRR